MNAFPFRHSLFLLLLLACSQPLAAQEGQAFGTMARINVWLSKNDPGASVQQARKSSNGYMVFHVLKTRPSVNENDSLPNITIWRENFFNEQGDWLESRVRVTEMDCELLGKDMCDALSLAEQSYLSQFNTPVSGTMVLISTPKYSWVEAPRPEGFALFDLWGHFLEERKF